ncbi:YwqG family protein [Flavilitoribacter nigricans]|uniref:DUF1963 domain-containing protein n=1 Tax=Flavilitoribacter nigricans (strain ATCC 23147 / DSM 23189 / NBRC 102662 / NCIMB 1420 / SS-2) TaxID=1122177 RepID=A0A2D0NHI1_FLAN2|nr:DUF1963 domain-containing protein [Flavilitoribacter nigricans]PHN07846.1 hypothetical protein CRP01_03595 [Flavilitoribacter nigricans DSM 23189 = NBRC 102662]
MIPTFLQPFAAELAKYRREKVQITATPRTEHPLSDPLDLKTSKFLGLPFFPESEKYPLDREGQPMLLMAQLNFAEIPHLPGLPKDGILQLYFSVEGWYEEDAAAIYHDKQALESTPMRDFSFLKPSDYEEMPIYKLHTLQFERAIDHGGSEDCQFGFRFGDLDFWEFSEQLTEEQKREFLAYFNAAGHKIGGYADFTQSDPRDYNRGERNDFHLLQIDMDEEIMFGDSGLAHLFIDPESLQNKDFTKAYFYWDCC